MTAAAEAGTSAGQQPEESPWQALFALHEHSSAYRECFLRVLRGRDSQLICAAVRALAAVVQSKAATPHVLSSAGQLLMAVGPVSMSPVVVPPSLAGCCTSSIYC